MCSDEPITDEELWGVPPEDMPEKDTERNFFDDAQSFSPQAGPGGPEEQK